MQTDKGVGEWVEIGAPIATIARIDRLHVHALVNSQQLDPQGCGDLPVSVHWTDPSTQQESSLRGKVLSVDPQVLPGGRFRLHAEIENVPIDDQSRQWQLYPGQEVRMKVQVPAMTAKRNALRLPR